MFNLAFNMFFAIMFSIMFVFSYIKKDILWIIISTIMLFGNIFFMIMNIKEIFCK